MILAALVVDAADNSLFAHFSSIDLGPSGPYASNLVLTYAGSRALSDRGSLTVATGLLFAYLTTLIVVLYDTYRPSAQRGTALDSTNQERR